jgi:hypothetical protein
LRFGRDTTMTHRVRQQLQEIVSRYGPSIACDAKRCEGLLRDLSPQDRAEISVLVAAIKDDVPAELQSSSSDAIPKIILLDRLSRRLQENQGISAAYAHWAVESWALALGKITEADLQSLGPSQDPFERGQASTLRVVTRSPLPTGFGGATPPSGIVPPPAASAPPSSSLRKAKVSFGWRAATAVGVLAVSVILLFVFQDRLSFLKRSPLTSTPVPSPIAEHPAIVTDTQDARRLAPKTSYEVQSNALSLAWSPDGRLLAAGQKDSSIDIRSVENNKTSRVLRKRPEGKYPWQTGMVALAFTRNGTMLASGGEDGVVTLWEVASGRLIRDLKGHTEPIHGLGFSPDGGRLGL